MRVLVCGGREFNDWHQLVSVLDNMNGGFGGSGVSLLIAGHARGADRLAEKWAEKRGVPMMLFPANWSGEGKSAGAKRNARMLVEGSPTLVVAFPGGKGTADMVRRARNEGITVSEVRPNIEAPTTAPETRQDRRSGVSAHGEPSDTPTGDTR